MQHGLDFGETATSTCINLYFFPDVIFWDPLSRLSLRREFLQCPKESCCGKRSCLRAVGWKDGKTKRDNPRRLYGLIHPVVLVSRIYRCQLSNHEVIAHDGDIIKQLSDKDRPPFMLSHITGMTRELQNTITSHILSGLSFCDIQRTLKQQLWNSLAERCRTVSVHFPNIKNLSPFNLHKDIQQTWSSPSNDFLESVFLADFMDKEKLYTAKMMGIEVGPNGWISMDHTFKVACNIGVKRKSDNKWEKLYDCYLCYE